MKIFIADCEPYLCTLQGVARDVAVLSYTAPKAVHRNLYDIKHIVTCRPAAK
jgi:hypothetical protein